MHRSIACWLTLAVAAMAGCSSHDATTAPTGPSFTNLSCSPTGTLQLASALAARVDCSNGGTTITLPGNGASYLVVPEFAVDQVANVSIPYHLSSGAAIATSRLPLVGGGSRALLAPGFAALGSTLPPVQPRAKQLAFDGMLRARARQRLASGAWRPASAARAAPAGAVAATVPAPPALGSTRAFRVLANANGTAFSTVGARLAYAGANVLLYIDTLAPANGFTGTQLLAFGKLFDQTLYPIDTAAFGPRVTSIRTVV